jgi:hypothetical protein
MLRLIQPELKFSSTSKQKCEGLLEQGRRIRHGVTGLARHVFGKQLFTTRNTSGSELNHNSGLQLEKSKRRNTSHFCT